MPTVSSWVAPATCWQDVSDGDAVLAHLVEFGRLLITLQPAPNESTPTHCFRVGPEYRIWQPEVGGAVFTEDRPELLLQPLAGSNRARFEKMVWRSWLPAIYPIWKRQVIHASAVASPAGDVIVFSGPSGACKSTTAYGLTRRDTWTLVADDALAFSCPSDNLEPIALHPLRRFVRLRQATAYHFGKSRAGEVAFEWPRVPLRLRAIYVLDSNSDLATPVGFSRLGAGEGFQLLLLQAFAMSLLEAHHNQRLMRDYLSLAASVPMFRFTFPKSFDLLESNLDQLERHAAANGVQTDLLVPSGAACTTRFAGALQ